MRTCEPRPDQSSGFALRYALEHERPLRGARAGVALIWLLFIIFPLANAIGTPGPTLEHGLTIAGAIIFVATYVVLVLTWRRNQRSAIPALACVAVLLACATALTLGEHSGWAFLFTYCAACTALIAPSSAGFIGVMLCASLAGRRHLAHRRSIGWHRARIHRQHRRHRPADAADAGSPGPQRGAVRGAGGDSLGWPWHRSGSASPVICTTCWATACR